MLLRVYQLALRVQQLAQAYVSDTVTSCHYSLAADWSDADMQLLFACSEKVNDMMGRKHLLHLHGAFMLYNSHTAQMPGRGQTAQAGHLPI